MLEWEIQHYIVKQLHRLGVLCHGDQNAGKRGFKAQMQSKATGMCRGWPDLMVILNGVNFFELKRRKGKLSPEQIEVHSRLALNGLEVHVIYADTGEEAWDQVRGILCL